MTLVVTVPEMLVVASNVPAKNMSELVALAKAQPGKLNFASTGPGSLPHLAGELLKLTARIDIVHVPYRGAAPAITDLLGQQVQMTFLDLPAILPHIRSGALKPIALGTTTRAPTAPDVPTTVEARHAGADDRELVRHDRAGGHAARDHRRAEQDHDSPRSPIRGVKERLAEQGLTTAGDSPEHFRDFIASETAKWAKVIKDAGIQTTK